MWLTKRFGVFKYTDSYYALIPTVLVEIDKKYMGAVDVSFRFLRFDINFLYKLKNNIDLQFDKDGKYIGGKNA